MSSTLSVDRNIQSSALPEVSAQVGHLAAGDGPMHASYPPTSGIATVRPASAHYAVPIRDARPIAQALDLDETGSSSFVPNVVQRLLRRLSRARPRSPGGRNRRAAVTTRRRSSCSPTMCAALHAPSAGRSACGFRSTGATTTTPCSRAPSAHGNIGSSWAPRPDGSARCFRRSVASDRRAGMGQPARGGDARSVQPDDLVATDILHFGEDNLEAPRHNGQILVPSRHRWFYVSRCSPPKRCC